jgi:hypothetical protein
MGVALLLFRLNAVSTTPLVQHSCMAIVTLPWRLSKFACLTPKRVMGLIWAAFQCKFILSWSLGVKAYPLELSMVGWMLSNYFNSPRIPMSTLYSHKMHWAAKHNLVVEIWNVFQAFIILFTTPCGYQLVQCIQAGHEFLVLSITYHHLHDAHCLVLMLQVMKSGHIVTVTLTYFRAMFDKASRCPNPQRI